MVISEEREALRDWKLPPSSASDVFEVNGCLGGLIPDWTVHTAEGEIVLYNKDSLSSGIFPNERKRWHESMGYIGLQVGMITVGLKPNKLGTDISATVSLRDMKFYPMFNIDDARIESNLHDGPIYFSHYSPFCFSLCDMPKRLTVVVKIGRAVKWNERVTLMYRFHYRVMRKFGSSAPSRPPRGEDGLPIFFVANVNAERNVSVEALRRLLLDRIAENNILTSGGRNASLDWRETGEEHVLKVDVPGFKEEEVRVEEAVVEGLRVLEINGERGQEEVEGRWHCVERINGKFLRRVRLPEDVKMDEMKVAVENGVLTVIVPKKVVYVEHSYMFDDD